MREILFRGKTIKYGEWIEGYYSGEWFNQKTCKIEPLSRICIIGCLATYDIEPETIGQYTGLTDKNGKKIFEGDIVVDTWSEDKWIVTFDDGTFWGKNVGAYATEYLGELCDLNEKGFGGVIVIGNIHDNPELLGGDEE